MVNLNTYYSSFLGSDRLFHNFDTFFHDTEKYPHHNIIKHNETDYVLELAVAGYNKNDLDVSLKKGILTIKGEKKVTGDVNYIHKGISTKKFIKNFHLVDTMEIQSAFCTDGVLIIKLHNNIPEDEKTKKIEISSWQRLYFMI